MDFFDYQSGKRQGILIEILGINPVTAGMLDLL